LTARKNRGFFARARGSRSPTPVPFRAAPHDVAYTPQFLSPIDHGEAIMKALAAEREKAEHVAPYARRALWP
jgi:hypothetical protein